MFKPSVTVTISYDSQCYFFSEACVNSTNAYQVSLNKQKHILLL